MTDTKILDWLENHEPINYDNGVLTYNEEYTSERLNKKYGRLWKTYMIESDSLRDCATKAMKEEE